MRHASTGFSVLKGERAVLMSALIEVVSMSKQFGTNQAVNSVSFSVDRGEGLGFLGPNGAGKSTTMRVITGFWRLIRDVQAFVDMIYRRTR